MGKQVEKGSWVEIHRIVLPAGERAPQVPEDTQAVPLEMRVKGFLITPAEIGDDVEIETPAGRREKGKLVADNPAYEHGFGRPIPELDHIAAEVRAMLANKDKSQ